LIILLPIITLAFIQIGTSNSSLSTTEAQQVANKLSAIATTVGSQGPPAKQVVTVQIPPNVQAIYVGGLNNTVGHEIIFVVSTNAGLSYVTAYVPLNVSGDLSGIESPATYLVNITAKAACPSNLALPCVFIKQA
jgi:hypothetical protein